MPKSLEELKSLSPDIAAFIAHRAEAGPLARRVTMGKKQTIRAKAGPPVKKVKGAAGYGSYLTVDWAQVRSSGPNLAAQANPRLVVSSGRKRRRAHR